MPNYNLSFISDEELYNHVLETVTKYRFDISLKDFNQNLVDPIKLTFDSKVYKRSMKEIIENESSRQLDKSNTNHIGYFHQNIFKYIGDGWDVPATGYDIVNLDKQIFVEMKNKHNTMNSSSSQKTYIRMQHTLVENPQATCLLVEVIANRSQNVPWSVTVDGNPMSSDRIRRVSIDKFYELVTGRKEAFRELCQVLPKVIEDVVDNIKAKKELNTVLKELQNKSPDILKSLYLLSFEKYEGFEDFNFE